MSEITQDKAIIISIRVPGFFADIIDQAVKLSPVEWRNRSDYIRAALWKFFPYNILKKEWIQDQVSSYGQKRKEALEQLVKLIREQGGIVTETPAVTPKEEMEQVA